MKTTWLYFKGHQEITIASIQQSDGYVFVDPSYTGRVQVSVNSDQFTSANATLTISNIQIKDSGITYVCAILYTSGSRQGGPRYGYAELIVVGKFKPLPSFNAKLS